MNQAMRPIPLAASAPVDVRCELLGIEALARRHQAWDSLVERAVYPNPHFSRRVILAHVEHGIGPPRPRFVAVWRGEDLLALLPFLSSGARVGFLRRAATPFTSPYVTNATPLVSGEAFEAGIDALAEGLALASGRNGLWRLPLLAIDSPVGQGLLAALGRRGFGHDVLSSYPRALLERRPSYEDFARTIGGRAKELRRCRKRLAGKGVAEHRAVDSGPELDAAVEAFLALEQQGWKGKRGTALACRPGTAAFARRLFGNGDDPVASRADLLMLDGRPIAVSLALICARTGCFLKTTYDETLRSCAPGLLLEDDIVRAAHETRFIDRLDAATVAGSVMDRIYPDRERIADVVVTTTAGQDLGPLVRTERRRQAMLARAKSLLGRLRSR